MNYIDMIVENLREGLGQDDLGALPGFRIGKYGRILEVVAPNGLILTLIDTGVSLSLYTAHADNFNDKRIVIGNLATVEATNFIFGFIVAHL